MSIIDNIVLALTAMMLAAGYFLPAVIALTRGHGNRAAIAIANLLFGWTVIGWGVALVWAFTNPVVGAHAPAAPASTTVDVKKATGTAGGGSIMSGIGWGVAALAAVVIAAVLVSRFLSPAAAPDLATGTAPVTTEQAEKKGPQLKPGVPMPADVLFGD